MVNYNCEKCGQPFKQKCHYDYHINRKNPCKPLENKIIDDKILEKIKELSEKGDIEIKNPNMDLSSAVINPIKHRLENTEGLEFMKGIDNGTIDLILTDPPYITSSETGMGNLNKKIKENKENGIEFMHSEEDWEKVKSKYVDKVMDENKKKDNYMKYGSIYGAKYSVQTEYGDWDKNFTMEILDEFIGEYYKKLKQGGTVIIFFDIWKITPLKELLEKHKFKQIRFIDWVKTNPQPLNSKTNYLTNCREIALLGVKGGKPTFNSKYDNSLYQYPLQGGKKRFHPTQKSLPLFEELITKHSNEGDTILDTFLGAGTSAIACKNTNRICKGCELSKEYYDKMIALL